MHEISTANKSEDIMSYNKSPMLLRSLSFKIFVQFDVNCIKNAPVCRVLQLDGPPSPVCTLNLILLKLRHFFLKFVLLHEKFPETKAFKLHK